MGDQDDSAEFKFLNLEKWKEFENMEVTNRITSTRIKIYLDQTTSKAEGKKFIKE